MAVNAPSSSPASLLSANRIDFRNLSRGRFSLLSTVPADPRKTPGQQPLRVNNKFPTNNKSARLTGLHASANSNRAIAPLCPTKLQSRGPATSPLRSLFSFQFNEIRLPTRLTAVREKSSDVSYGSMKIPWTYSVCSLYNNCCSFAPNG